MPSHSHQRSRLLVALWVPAVVAAGLLSRAELPVALPGLVRAYGGDTLYASLIYVLLAFIAPARTARQLVVGAWGICLLVELSQLSSAGWLVGLRATRLGALVLGRGFLWSDLLCYAAGALAAGAVDVALRKNGSRP